MTKNKEELARLSITLYKSDLANFENLKSELAPKTLSGMIRYLLQYAVDNTNLIKENTTPDKNSLNKNELKILINSLILKKQEQHKKEREEDRIWKAKIEQALFKKEIKGLGGKIQ